MLVIAICLATISGAYAQPIPVNLDRCENYGTVQNPWNWYWEEATKTDANTSDTTTYCRLVECERKIWSNGTHTIAYGEISVSYRRNDSSSNAVDMIQEMCDIRCSRENWEFGDDCGCPNCSGYACPL